MAKLYFRYGAMGSSKTANALMVKFNYEERGGKVMLLKPSTDTRATQVESRIGLSSEAIMISPDDNLYPMIKQVDCVIVDEAQFLTPKQVEELSWVVDAMNIPVICYGLRADFQGKLFPGSERLLAIADTIEEVKTVCWCGRKAIMNARIVDGKVVYDGPQVLIGGNDSYTALCRRHWRNGRLSYEDR